MTVNARTPAQNAGRPFIAGTVLAARMKQRHIKAHQVARALRVSERTLYNYMTRKYPVPALRLGPLCDRLDMDPDELVDHQGFLLRDRAGDVAPDRS